MKKLFSFIFAACMAVTAFAAEEVSTCPAGTLADGKVTHELECCTIVQEQGESTTALKSVSPWQAPAKSIMTITPKAGVSIEKFSVNTKNTTLATYIGKTELTNATKTTTQGTVVTFVVTDPTQPVVMKFVSTTIKFAELTITYTGGTTTAPDPEQPADTTVTPTPEPEPEPQPTTETVYFINAQNWSGTIKAYAWTSTSNAAWPGVAMTKEAEQIGGKDVYSYTAAPGAYKNVIFNNGSTQTKDLVWQAGKYYVVDNWYTKDEAIAKLGAPIADTWTVVGGSGLLGSNWSLTDEANDMTLQADGTYKLVKENLSLAACSYEYKAAKNRGWDVAVPQSGNQTLKISKAGKYTVTFVLDVNATKLTATATIQEEVEVIPTVAIAGDMNEWNTSANLLTLAADKLTATATINLAEAKDYGFKVVLGGNWLSDGGAVTREASSLVFTGANAEANTTLTADVAGDYTFTWTYATSTLVVTYPALAPDPEQPGDTTVTPEPEPVAETWTVVGAEGLMGTGWDLNNKENDMALQADGTYKLVKENLTLAAGNHEYKAAKDRAWTTAVPQDGNQTLTISKAGKYTVTFVLDINASKLTATPTLQEEVEVIPTVAIAGDMNEWNTSANLLVLAADKLTATATINLAEAKDYGFKVVLGGNWLSDGGAVTREAATLVFTGANTQANTTLTADVAGEYTFTWTYATNTLVVTYPAKSTVGFENIEATENAVKFIENGKLYIIREGNVYDATGARVK